MIFGGLSRFHSVRNCVVLILTDQVYLVNYFEFAVIKSLTWLDLDV